MSFTINEVKTESFSITPTTITVHKGKHYPCGETLPGIKYLGESTIAEQSFNEYWGVMSNYDPSTVGVKLNGKLIGNIMFMNVNNTTRTVTIKRSGSCLDIKNMINTNIKVSINDVDVCDGRIIEYGIKRASSAGSLLEEIVIYNDNIT